MFKINSVARILGGWVDTIKIKYGTTNMAMCVMTAILSQYQKILDNNADGLTGKALMRKLVRFFGTPFIILRLMWWALKWSSESLQ